MTTFVAIFRGDKVETARVIGFSSDRELVSQVASRILDSPPTNPVDPILLAVERGRRQALHLIASGEDLS